MDEFIATIYSVSLFTKSTKPNRITANGPTLINNIFINDTDNKTVSGFLIKNIETVFQFSMYEMAVI